MNHTPFRREGVYPYDYMDSFDRFEETELPSQYAFFSKLSGSPCSDSGYTHATQVWNAFQCKTIADYHEIYLQLDVLLLADCFEKFRKTLLHRSWSCMGCCSSHVTCRSTSHSR